MIHKARAIAVLRIALAAGVAVPFVLTSTGAATQTSSPGEACMFNAPDGAHGFGHVGWGFRNGTADNWVFGATEDTGGSPIIPPGPDAKAQSQSWHNSGTYSQMLNAFGIGSLTDSQTGAHYNDGPGYYRRYRCSLLNTSYPSAAMNAVSDVETGSDSGYDFFSNNCLTKAVIILGAYGFLSLPGAAFTKPNDYFLGDLPNPTPSTPGFSGAQYFTTLTIGVKVVDPITGQYLNTNPVDQQRPIRIVVLNAAGQQVYDSGFSAMANLTPNTDRYQATLQLPTDTQGPNGHGPVWSTGGSSPYQVEVQLKYTLLKYVSGTVNISQGQNATAPDTPLTAGDVNGDNQVNIADYDVLLRCYSDLQPPKGPCSPQDKAGSDLNDDGNVNGYDYNEMVRIFRSQGGP